MTSRHELRGELTTVDEVRLAASQPRELRDRAVQGVDLRGVDLDTVDVTGALFLGCRFGDDRTIEAQLVARGAFVFPRLPELPYDPWRHRLYDPAELMQGYDSGGYTGTRDFAIYAWYDRHRRSGRGIPIAASLAMRIHDHAIDDALEEWLDTIEGRGIVGIMGGHSTLRTDPRFMDVVETAWLATRAGFTIATGGGPGIMEAGNLGAWLANWSSRDVLAEAVSMLAPAPKYAGPGEEGTDTWLAGLDAWMTTAQAVVARFGPDASDDDVERFGRERPEPGRSLAIPTWFYGHEPSNLFSPAIAKYFANSIREDGLLAISTAGVIYAPGSAGTLQEVFMDLAQNHYATFASHSPMVFLGHREWGPMFGAVVGFVAAKGQWQSGYGELIDLVETPDEAVAFLDEHAMRPVERGTPLWERRPPTFEADDD